MHLGPPRTGWAPFGVQTALRCAVGLARRPPLPPHDGAPQARETQGRRADPRPVRRTAGHMSSGARLTLRVCATRASSSANSASRSACSINRSSTKARAAARPATTRMSPPAMG
jgi:hypothetical protein